MKIRPDHLEADYAIFAKIVLLWAHVESALADLILTLTFAPFKLSKHQGVPRSFSKKCELALRGFETIEAMTPIRGYGIAIIEPLGPFHELRSVIVHGHFRGRSVKGYEFAVFNTKENKLGLKTLSEKQPEALAQKIVELRDRLQQLAAEAKELRAKWRAPNN